MKPTNGVVAEVLFVDGVKRPVHQEPGGRQYVLDENDNPIYGIWFLQDIHLVEPDTIIEKASACVLVTGGRDYQDRQLLFETLDRLHAERGIAVLIHGDASGADKLAGEWAAARGIEVRAQPADWKKHGRAAGPIRNQAMLAEKPQLVVAFPGGKGTADMVKKAKKAGIEVIMVDQ